MIRIAVHLSIVCLTLLYVYGSPFENESVKVIEEPEVIMLQAPEDVAVDPYALSASEQECLALNVYFEARNQSSFGQMAVTMVVLNRVKDNFWPDTICGVIKQGSYTSGRVARHHCQFSWYCDGLSDRPKNKVLWSHSNDIATAAYSLWLDGYDIVEGATNYHSNKVNPVWVGDRGMTYVATIDDHRFYNWLRYDVVYN